MMMEYQGSKNDLLESKSYFNLYLASCATCLMGISLGCSLSWTSPTLPKLLVPNDHVLITSVDAAWLSSLLCFGGILGPILNILLVDRIGRKYTLVVYGCCMMLSWTLLALSSNISIMFLARFINGLTAGPTFILIPMYIAEISTADTRGVTGTFFSIFINFGCCIPYFVGPFTSYVTLIEICIGITMIGTLACLWVPESPCYLIAKGNKLQAYDTVSWLLGSPDHFVLENEVNVIQKSFDLPIQEKNDSCLQCFSKWTNIKSFYYCCVIIFVQQVCGMSAVVYYTETLFRQTGSSISAIGSSMICGTIFTLAAIMPTYFSKILRVKRMLQVSNIGCSFFMIILSSYFFMKDKDMLIPLFNLLPIISVLGFIISFAFGIGPYTGVVLIEILPIDLKVKGSAVLTMYSWTLAFMFTRFYNTVSNAIGSTGTFGFFALVCAYGAYFISYQIPETQGLTFLEIEQLIKTGKIPPKEKSFPLDF